MELVFKKNVIEEIGSKVLSRFDDNFADWQERRFYRESVDMKIANWPDSKVNELERLLKTYFTEKKKVRGVGVILSDIALWRHIKRDVESAKPRTVEHANILFRRFMLRQTCPWLYSRASDGRVLAWFVEEINYHPPMIRDGRVQDPEHVHVELLYMQFGKIEKNVLNFYEQHVRQMTPRASFEAKGYFVETPELRAEYEADFARFNAVMPCVGKQFTAVGIGHFEVDDLGVSDNSKLTEWKLDRNNEPSRVLVDVFDEGKEEGHPRRSNRRVDFINQWWWRNVRSALTADDDEELLRQPEWEFEPEESPVINIPVHPFVAIFDLTKHRRMSTHVRNLTEYVYDVNLGSKLVLRNDIRALVSMLLEYKEGSFIDIVRGKTGGAVVLLSGPPGVGKTLTAEIFSEASQRPLYSVQCSQLGSTPDDLEENLMLIFTRAKRFNAILLLDEADVYIKSRGSDLTQNAIVGVFLRVLEYRAGLMFLTTNRPKDVDDAIASRCVARLRYQIPSKEHQKKIWRVLADNTKANISDETIEDIVASNDYSGRDIKNLLKLAMLLTKGKEIEIDVLAFVERFRPVETEDDDDAPFYEDDDVPGAVELDTTVQKVRASLNLDA